MVTPERPETPSRAALLLTFAGAALVVLGVALFSIPLAIILAGLAIGAVGLLADLEALRP